MALYRDGLPVLPNSERVRRVEDQLKSVLVRDPLELVARARVAVTMHRDDCRSLGRDPVLDEEGVDVQVIPLNVDEDQVSAQSDGQHAWSQRTNKVS